MKEANTNQLVEIVNNSGLEATKAQFVLEQFKDYFTIAAEWEARAKTIVVTDERQTVDMQLARTGRLFLREKRIAIEKARKALKEQALREGKAIDGIANVLKGLIEPIEEYLDKQENYVVYKQAAEAEAARLEAERKAEQERVLKEKQEAEERERIRLENEKLRAEAAKREAEAAAERAKHAKEIAEVRAKADAEQRALQEKAAQERQAALEEQAKVQKELEAKRAKHANMITCPACQHRFSMKEAA